MPGGNAGRGAGVRMDATPPQVSPAASFFSWDGAALGWFRPGVSAGMQGGRHRPP